MSNTVQDPATTISRFEVEILFSENKVLRQHKGKHEGTTLINGLLASQSYLVMKEDCGCDKTDYILRIFTEDGEEHAYKGGIDIGRSCEGMVFVIQENIESFINYCLNADPKESYCAITSEEGIAEAKMFLDLVEQTKSM